MLIMPMKMDSHPVRKNLSNRAIWIRLSSISCHHFPWIRIHRVRESLQCLLEKYLKALRRASPCLSWCLIKPRITRTSLYKRLQAKVHAHSIVSMRETLCSPINSYLTSIPNQETRQFKISLTTANLRTINNSYQEAKHCRFTEIIQLPLFKIRINCLAIQILKKILKIY